MFTTNIEEHCYEYNNQIGIINFKSQISFFASENEVNDWKSWCVELYRDKKLKEIFGK